MKHTSVALVTGSAGGVGSAIASLFAAQGWRVVGVDRRNADITADLTNLHHIQRIAKTVHARYGRLDAIINNAAEQVVKSLKKTTAAEWDRTMAANVRPAYLLPARLYDLLAASHGAVVNIASVHAIATSPGMAAYVASKGALVALTRAMALEFAASGIRVNAVLPGAIDTPMLAAGLKRSRITPESFAARHPLNRLGKPGDVAQAVFFLASASRSGFITGQTLIVDGGATARLSTE